MPVVSINLSCRNLLGDLSAHKTMKHSSPEHPQIVINNSSSCIVVIKSNHLKVMFLPLLPVSYTASNKVVLLILLKEIYIFRHHFRFDCIIVGEPHEVL